MATCGIKNLNKGELFSKHLLVPAKELANAYKIIGSEIFDSEYSIQEEDREELKQALLQWKNGILPMVLRLEGPRSESAKFLQSLDENSEELENAVTSIINWKGDTVPAPTQQMNTVDPEDDDRDTVNAITRVTEQQLDEIYQSAQEAKLLMQQGFKKRLTDAILINYKEGIVVSTAEDVNQNIAQYKEELVKTILDYANNYADRNVNIKLYNEDGTLNLDNLAAIESLAEALFKDVTDAQLNDAYTARQKLPKQKSFLDAFNAWIIFHNFDMLIKQALGKSVNVHSSYLNTETNNSIIKYQLVNNSDLVQTWRNSEDVDALSELGDITTLLIESTPLYSYNDNDPVLHPGQYLKVKDFVFAFSEIMKNSTLKGIASNIRYNPIVFIPTLIQAALNMKQLGSSTKMIHNVLYSVQQHLFRTNHTDGPYSLAEIMIKQKNTLGNSIGTDYLDYVAATIDKTVRMSHVTYGRDAEGNIVTYLTQDRASSNSEISTKNSIESYNRMVGTQQRNILLQTYSLSNVEYYKNIPEEERTESTSSFPSVWTITTNVTLGGKNYKMHLRFFNNISSDYQQSNKDTVQAIYLEDNEKNITPIYKNSEGFYQSFPDTFVPEIENALVQMFDKTLHLNFSDKTFLDNYVLNTVSKQSGKRNSTLEALLGLIPMSGRVLIKHTLEAKGLDNNIELLDKVYKIDAKYQLAQTNGTIERPYLNKGKLKCVMDSMGDRDQIKILSLARMLSTGEISKATSKNVEGNTVSNNGLTNLMNTVALIWHDAKKKIDNELRDSREQGTSYRHSCLRDCVFVQSPEFFNGIVQKQGARSQDSSKLDKKFNIAESLESAFKYDFLVNYGIDPENARQGLILIQPTDYSDKTTNYLIQINGNTPIGEGKSLLQMTPEEIENLHKKQMGGMYRRLSINLGKDYHATLSYFVAQNLDTLGISRQQFESLRVQDYYGFYNTIVFPKINANIEKFGYKSAQQLYRDLAAENNTTVITNVHFDDKAKANGKAILASNNVIDYYITVFTDNDPKLYQFVLKRNQLRFVKTMSHYLDFDWDSNGDPDPIYSKALDRLVSNGTITKEEFINNWVNPKTGELILARLNGAALSKQDIKNLKVENLLTNDAFQLNPLLRVFYSIDTMVSQQFITSTTGGSFVHKNNFGKPFSQENLTLDQVEEEDAGRLLTQYKRMVIYPATMHPYFQEALEGTATYYNIACINDVQAHIWDYINGDVDEGGDFKSEDAHDGSGWVDPGVALLENGSLQGAHVGIDKKPIGHNMNDGYLTETELKYALFALTNERIRNSSSRTDLDSVQGINLKRVRQKMGTATWDVPVDLTRKFNGEQITVNDLQSTYLYDPEVRTYFRITNIEKGAEDNHYIFTYQAVDEQGNDIAEIESAPVDLIIDNNYALWDALGGEWSCSLQDGKLIPDESSNYNWAYFANNVGTIRTKENPLRMDLIHETQDQLLSESDITTEDGIKKFNTLITQKDVYQPLKYSGIQYLVNVSAIKNGQTNTNLASSYYDDTPLRFHTISTKHLGVQMNADHHADDAELTEMSQVISALEANGWAHPLVKQIYEDLGSIVLQTLDEETQALKAYMNTGDSTAIYRLVGKTFIKSFSKDNDQDSLTSSLMRNIVKGLEEQENIENAPQKIPFSDLSILNSVVGSITSNINRTAIKRKYAGLAAVLIPAYDMIKIYKQQQGDTYKDALHANIIMSNTDLDQQTLDGALLGSGDIELGLSYVIYDKQGDPLRQFKSGNKLYYIGHSFDGVLTLYDINGNIINDPVSDELQQEYARVTTGNPLTPNKNLPVARITLNSILDYRRFRKSGFSFKEDFTAGRNLQPSKTTFKLLNEDSTYSIFDTDQIQNKLEFRSCFDKFKGLSPDRYKTFFFTPETLDQLEGAKGMGYNGHILNRVVGSSNNDRIVQLYKSIKDIVNKPTLTTFDELRIQKYMDMLESEFANEVVLAFQDLHNKGVVRIGNQELQVDKSSIVVKPAELVVSKIYATKFGIKKGDNLNDIDLNYFIRQLTDAFAVKTEIYDVVLRRDNGRHTYVLFNRNKDKLTKNGFVKTNPSTRIDPISGNKILINNMGEDVMPFNNCELYVKDGIEVVVTDDPGALVDDRFEYSSFDTNPRSRYALEDLKVFDQIPLTKITPEESRNYIQSLAQRKYTSFQQSLEFIAARIPAQALQSFMPMQVVGFTESEDNKAYVSHFQTYLQGSDYDIDKVYLMGNEFTESGIYIGWSPYFNLTTLQHLKLSQQIPMPNGIEYTFNNTGVDITRHIMNIKMAYTNYGQNSTEYLAAVKDMLNDVSNEKEGNVTFDVHNLAQQLLDNQFVKDPTAALQYAEDEATRVLNIINRHSSYFKKVKNKDMRLKMTKNSVTSKMFMVANLPENTYAAYSPINMGESKEAATKSLMGSEEKNYTTFNPASKFVMHFQNMMGKDGIGISAVGEKALFCLQYYFNEALNQEVNLEDIDSDNFKYQRNAFFHKELNMITNGAERLPVIRNLIANVNLQGRNDTIWHRLIINNAQQLESLNAKLGPERVQFLQDILLLQLYCMKDSSLVNSALLSAATDNAKELILAKINANPDMMKIYIYGIILGIDFNDIADLMTSPTVNAINDLSDVNIFQETSGNNPLNSAMNSLRKGINVSDYMSYNDKDYIEAYITALEAEIINTGQNGTYQTNTELFYRDKRQLVGLMDAKSKVFSKALKNVHKGKQTWQEFATVWQNAVNGALRLADAMGMPSTPPAKHLYRYLYKVQEWLNTVSTIDNATLQVFEELLAAAKELSSFGRILGINQGINTSIADKIAYLNKLESVFKDRIKLKSTDILKAQEILASKPYYASLYGSEQEALNYIMDTIERARKANIIDDFNILKFFNDAEYRELAIDTYDLLKDTINILDVISRVPHFRAMVDASGTDFYLFSTTSSVFNLMYNISHDLLQRGRLGALTSKQVQQFTRDLQNFIQSQITLKYFKENQITVPIGQDIQVVNSKGEFAQSKENEKLNLGTIEGQASFKLWMEQVVVPNLQQGITEDGNTAHITRGLLTNKFIQDLISDSTTRTTTADEKAIITLPINMSTQTSEYNQTMFVAYLSEFNALRAYTYNGISLQTLFFWYNLIVNRNIQSESSLTKIFKSAIGNNNGNNDINNYFKYVGDMDRDQLLSVDDFEVDDLLLSCAPKVSRSWLTSKKYEILTYPRFVKCWDFETGTYKLYEFDESTITTSEEYSDDSMDDDMGFYEEYESMLDGQSNVSTFKPIGYRELNTNPNMSKAEVANLYPFLTRNSVTSQENLLTHLTRLIKQRKIFIYNDCG